MNEKFLKILFGYGNEIVGLCVKEFKMLGKNGLIVLILGIFVDL